MSESFIKCNNRLKSLRPVFKEWISVNRQYCEEMAWEDCGWWANERTSTGLLAVAAWRARGIALEEYVTKKVKKKRSRKQKHRSGRCDLFFTTRSDQFACEMKQIFPRLSKKNTSDISKIKKLLSKIKEQFGFACNDAQFLFPEEGRRLGVCFVTPRFSKSQIEEMEKSLGNFLECLKEKIDRDCDAIAWYFPKKAGKMKWKDNDCTYPGIVILVKDVFRGK